MLPSVSNVCLVCALVCESVRSIYRCKCQGFSSRSWSFKRSGFFIVVFLLWFILCMCLCPRIFSDVYNSSMWEELHASIPEGDETLSTIAESPPDVVLAGRTGGSLGLLFIVFKSSRILPSMWHCTYDSWCPQPRQLPLWSLLFTVSLGFIKLQENSSPLIIPWWRKF